MTKFRIGLFAFALVFPGFLVAQDSSDLSVDEFEKLHKEVDTPQDKPWRSIPWKVSLLEAQNEAAKSNKPIFIWAMDGHPLGCT